MMDDNERRAHDRFEELMAMTDADQRRQALHAALSAFEEALSEQDCWIPDAMARVATLEQALEEHGERLDESLADVPSGLVH
jgi:C4-dicarboxylate-specific signal transduction histidine kinase